MSSLPREIAWEDIQAGDLIESRYTDGARVSFVATPAPWGKRWGSPSGGVTVSQSSSDTGRVIYLLEREPEPLPPEALATILVYASCGSDFDQPLYAVSEGGGDRWRWEFNAPCPNCGATWHRDKAITRWQRVKIETIGEVYG